VRLLPEERQSAKSLEKSQASGYWLLATGFGFIRISAFPDTFGYEAKRPAASNQQPATSSQQPAASNQQPATSSQQPAAKFDLPQQLR
jgi:hypothetical protein